QRGNGRAHDDLGAKVAAHRIERNDRAIPHDGSRPALPGAPRLFFLVRFGLGDDLDPAVKAVGGHAMTQVRLTRGGVHGKGRRLQPVVRTPHTAPRGGLATLLYSHSRISVLSDGRRHLFVPRRSPRRPSRICARKSANGRTVSPASLAACGSLASGPHSASLACLAANGSAMTSASSSTSSGRTSPSSSSHTS